MNREIEFKRLCCRQLLVLGLVLFMGFCLNHITFRYFKRVLINNNNVIAGTIVANHPELETEIIGAILKGNKQDYDLLNKYDLDNMESIEQLSLVKDVKRTMYFFQTMYFIGGFILVSLPYLLYLWRQRRRLRELSQDLTRALHDDFTIHPDDYQEGTISNLKNELHKMIQMLKDYSDALKQDKMELEKTLSDISHQIKTPLTSMYVINEILADEKLDPKKKNELLLKNRKQLERMGWLVSSLLKISRLDSGVVTLTQKEIRVPELIQKATAPLLIPMEIKRQELVLDLDDIGLLCDTHWTVEALINIIKNAHEHTPTDGTITITAKENPIYTCITISDNGVGISKKDMPYIFERFYKGSAHPDSIGIGLNMAKTIINKQNGDITVQSKKNKGTTFLIKFYKNGL